MLNLGILLLKKLVTIANVTTVARLMASRVILCRKSTSAPQRSTIVTHRASVLIPEWVLIANVEKIGLMKIL